MSKGSRIRRQREYRQAPERWEALQMLTHCPCPFCKDEPIHVRWANSAYLVEVHFPDRDITKEPEYVKIWRRDMRPVRSWQDLQRIKNEIAGPHREAVELFPDEDRLIDTENCYWLWFSPDGEWWDVGIPLPRMTGTEAAGKVDPSAGGRQSPRR